MPNWVFNKVYFNGKKEKIEELRNFVASEETVFDFNKIRPMPEELNLVSGWDEQIARKCASARRNGQKTCDEYENSKQVYDRMSFEEWADLGEKYLSNVEKYGASTWYDWCIENWGTKWNASQPAWQGDDMIVFDTAWSVPMEIYERLASLFPDVRISVDYADEDLGNNCGHLEYKGYWRKIEYIDSFAFACDVWGYDVNEMYEQHYGV